MHGNGYDGEPLIVCVYEFACQPLCERWSVARSMALTQTLASERASARVSVWTRHIARTHFFSILRVVFALHETDMSPFPRRAMMVRDVFTNIARETQRWFDSPECVSRTTDFAASNCLQWRLTSISFSCYCLHIQVIFIFYLFWIFIETSFRNRLKWNVGPTNSIGFCTH